MPAYQEMPEEELRELLEAYAGEASLLDDEKKKEEAWRRNTPCPRCGGPASACFSTVQTVFQAGSLLPRHNYECNLCGAEYTPQGILVRLGNIGAAIERAMTYQTPWVTPASDEE